MNFSHRQFQMGVPVSAPVLIIEERDVAEKSRNFEMRGFNLRALIVQLSEAYRHHRAKGMPPDRDAVHTSPTSARCGKRGLGAFLIQAGLLSLALKRPAWCAGRLSCDVSLY